MPVPAPTLESCEKVRERTGPPPNVLSARFTSTGENILVDLDAASDQAGKLAGEYFSCTALLDFADVDTAECVWVDATQISAEVNKALNFVPGENVTLRAQTTMLACDDDRCDCRVGNTASRSTRMLAPVDENRAESTSGGGPVRSRTFSHDSIVGASVGAGTGTAVGFPGVTVGAGVGLGVGLGVVGCAVDGAGDGAAVGGRDDSTPPVSVAIIECDASWSAVIFTS